MRPKPLDEVRRVARLKHLSLSTEKAYVYYIRQFIIFHDKCHPREMGAEETSAFFPSSPLDSVPQSEAGRLRRAHDNSPAARYN